MKFNNIDNNELFLLTSNCSLEILNVSNDKCVFKKTIINTHQNNIYDVLCIAKNIYVTCGYDGILKVW